MIKAFLRAWFGQTPKPGERYVFDDENPFKEREVFVDEVRGGWVRYKSQFLSGWVADDLPLSSFRFCYRPADR